MEHSVATGLLRRQLLYPLSYRGSLQAGIGDAAHWSAAL